MEKEELVKEIGSLLEDKNLFRVMSVDNVNHRPHPFMIGPRHIAHASDNHGGRLGEITMRKIGCVHPGCTTSYDDHTSDKVLFLQLTRDAKNNKEATGELKKLVGIMGQGNIAGLTLVETPEKFRIADPVIKKSKTKKK